MDSVGNSSGEDDTLNEAASGGTNSALGVENVEHSFCENDTTDEAISTQANPHLSVRGKCSVSRKKSKQYDGILHYIIPLSRILH